MQCPSRPGLVAAPGREGERLSLLGAAVLEVRVGEVGLEVVFLAFFVLLALVLLRTILAMGLVFVLGVFAACAVAALLRARRARPLASIRAPVLLAVNRRAPRPKGVPDA